MSIASVLQDTKARLDSLLSYANETTGQSDASIGDAIKTLADGFGGGGGVATGTFSVDSATDTYTFDCSVDSPSFLFVFAETETGKPTNQYAQQTATMWYKLSTGAFGLIAARANTGDRSAFHNWGYGGGNTPVCGVNGSTVTLKTYNGSMYLIQPNITYRWYAW